MSKTINQVFEEYLAEQKPKLSTRTFKYHEDTLSWLEHCINGYGYNNLERDEDKKLFDENYKKDTEFCDTFGSEILDSSYFAEFLGYFYPKKVAMGYDTAKKICGATCNFYKWCVREKYITHEEESDEVELQEAVRYLRDCFRDGWEQYNSFDYEF